MIRCTQRRCAGALDHISRFSFSLQPFAEMSGRRVVTDAALATRLKSARAAIGDNGSERLIKTLQRKGFRFVGAVREVDGEVDTTAANAEAGLFHLSASGTSSHPSGATRAVVGCNRN